MRIRRRQSPHRRLLGALVGDEVTPRRTLERRSEGWYVATRAGGFGGYSTASVVASRRRVPVPIEATAEQAADKAVELGMIRREELR